jgi:FkbM family methyltransferase
MQSSFENGDIDKHSFIKLMYEEHHAKLFDYASFMSRTNIKKIDIEDGKVTMTSRDRGVKIICTVDDHRIAPIEILNFLDYETDESMMMERLIKDGDTFFDVGANIGWYSINIALSRRASKIFSFEPIPMTYSNLRRNMEINAVQNITAHNFGLSNQAGEFAFYYYPEGSGNASAKNLTERSDVEVVQCRVRTLDDFVAEKRLSVDFIKCDVEGAELMVFQGGLETIKRDLPIVFSEILRKWSSKFNYNPNEIFDFFRTFGYNPFTVKDGTLKLFNKMDETTIETNFFFLHSVKHAQMLRQNS